MCLDMVLLFVAIILPQPGWGQRTLGQTFGGMLLFGKLVNQ